ncbi:hypothetical protein [Geomonas subterranea]|uniref:Uncharacterized protein n=1 Tax=Geomonas subterranea TaxID=2847989 RepID=A0ABX8LFA5_9BACT|nr:MULTISPECIES: hypothetical protein [Geomonas]QXE90726.1 hypothetical protein KP001_20420 [Geomonas subterranea]QXM11192.1 hypothetical protein KP002_08860 [Geomonas subterranea]
MIYLTNDALDQAVYFEMRGKEALRTGKSFLQVYHGLLGNGVHEVEVTLKKKRGAVEVAFGDSALFCFVEEDALRRMLEGMIKEKTVH